MVHVPIGPRSTQSLHHVSPVSCVFFTSLCVLGGYVETTLFCFRDYLFFPAFVGPRLQNILHMVTLNQRVFHELNLYLKLSE